VALAAFYFSHGMKTGRNDPCPCGSEKKFKKCCLGKAAFEVHDQRSDAEKEVSELDVLLKTFDQMDLLKTIGALQLVTSNHGKNVRFEMLAQLVLKQGSRSKTKIDHQSLENFFANNFEDHYMEDPPINFFTENAIFYGGDFIVYPGISSHGASVLRSYLEALFIFENDLPKKFLDELFSGIIVVLALCDHAARHTGHVRYLYEEGYGEPISIPGQKQLLKFKNALVFSEELVKAICDHYGVSVDAINDFVVNPEIIDPESYDPYDNPMVFAPFVRDGSDLILVLPTAEVDALIDFIKRKAMAAGLSDVLETCHLDWQFNECVNYAQELGMELTDIKLPDTNKESQSKEAVFRLDNDKLAYLRFMYPSNKSEDDTSNDGDDPSSDLQKRDDEVLEYLQRLNSSNSFRYLTINIVGENGSDRFFIWPKAKSGNQTVCMTFSQFQRLCFDGSLDRLTLWKFAKAFSRAAEKMNFSMLDVLDMYVIFKNNEGSFLPSDDSPPSFMAIAPGTSGDFGRDILLRRDEHAANKFENGKQVSVPVVRHKQYAPIYRGRDWSKNVMLLLEEYSFPIWITNAQATSKREKNNLSDFVEAVAFWLFKLGPQFSPYLNQLDLSSFEIELKIDPRLYSKHEEETVIKDVRAEEINILCSIVDQKLTVEIPFEIAHLLIGPKNEGERMLMQNILTALNKMLVGHEQMDNAHITSMLDQVMPLGNAKMILMINAEKINVRMHLHGLVPVRRILETETSYVLDNLTSYLPDGTSIPESISSAKEKNDLCNKVVSSLIKRIVDKLKDLNARDLLHWLMRHNEALIQNRELQEIQIPAKIACFSDFPSELEEFRKMNRQNVSTGLALRSLIEFVAADPPSGNKLMSIDELDELLALMNEVIIWGLIADSIYLKMDDPRIGLLPSGRLHVSDSGVVKALDPFSDAKTEEELSDIVEGFGEKISPESHTDNVQSAPTESEKEIDLAFAEEYGISLTNLMPMKGTMINLSLEEEKSVHWLEEQQLKTELHRRLPELNDDIIEKGLQVLTLFARDSLVKAPDGFEKDDIYPWKYNRELSYRRRPLVKVFDPAEKKYYFYWGYRHVMDAAEYVRYLLASGRLRAKKSDALKSVLSGINNKKGKNFREQVKDWLRAQPDIEVIENEVSIKKNGQLKTTLDDLGDIDVFAFNRKSNIIYSIECKNTVAARVIHEMKTEMDNYLGRNEGEGMVWKHVSRDKWLNDNIDQVKEFWNTSAKVEIRSIVVTSAEVPTAYLAAERIPLPLISFASLKKRGKKILD
jgi:hypothetical protein